MASSAKASANDNHGADRARGNLEFLYPGVGPHSATPGWRPAMADDPAHSERAMAKIEEGLAKHPAVNRLIMTGWTRPGSPLGTAY